jgi:hypothetical protein
MSDVSFDYDDEKDYGKSLEPPAMSMSRKQSSSTLSTSGLDHANETQIASTMAYLSPGKIYVSELKHQKERFEVILKYSSKIEASLTRDISNPHPTPPKDSNPYVAAINSMPVTEGNEEERATKRLKVGGEESVVPTIQSQKSTLQETRLESQLVRLETLVKTCQDNSVDLIKKLELVKEERLLKDNRYSKMIAVICRESPELMGEILEKLSEQYDY